MSRCSGCKYGSYDPSSDICDGCTSDPDTGWGGFTDHSVGKHFSNEDERDEYYKRMDDFEDDEMPDNF